MQQYAIVVCVINGTLSACHPHLPLYRLSLITFDIYVSGTITYPIVAKSKLPSP